MRIDTKYLVLRRYVVTRRKLRLVVDGPDPCLLLSAVPQAMAQKEGVQIHSHKVIYRFLDDVKAVMSALLPPAFKETVIGEAKTLQVSGVRAHWFLGVYSTDRLVYCRALAFSSLQRR